MGCLAQIRDCEMRILFLSLWFPFPPDNGSKMRIYNLLRALAQRHAITLLSFVGQGEPIQPDGLKGLCEVIRTVPWKPYQPTRWKALLGLFSPRPRFLVDTDSPAMRRLLHEELAQRDYDVIIGSQIGAAVYVAEAQGKAKVFEEVEVGSYLTRLQTGQGLQRLRHAFTWAKHRRFLRGLIARFDACTVVSEVEERWLVAIGVNPDRLALIPNGVDLGWYSGVEPIPQADTLIFNGALTYFANYRAMAYFLERIYPLIRAECPQVRLAITGRTEGVDIAALCADESVTFTGYVPDIRPLVAGSSVCIVPLLEGGGTRLKILEAMALGTPVVATSKGAEGLGATHGEHLLIADDPAEFARHTLALLRDAALRARLATNARAFVQARYDWEPIGRQFTALVESISSLRSK